MRAPLFLGVDGGGTRCRARICDADGNVLGEGVAGAATMRLGLTRVFAEIQRACEQALAAAGLAAGDIGRLHAGLGLAALVTPKDREQLDQFAHPFASLVAETDAYISCLGAHAGRDGAVLILGTGSCGCAFVKGATLTLGGWGFELADQASGAALGRAALRQSLWAFEGVRPATALSRAVMARFHDRPEQAVRWAYQAQPRDYAELAPLVFEYAADQDALAQSLVGEIADDTATLIRTLVNKGAPSVVLRGGLAAPLTPFLADDVQALLSEAKGDALDGALRMIRRHHETR